MALVLPGGRACPSSAPLLMPSLAAEEAAAKFDGVVFEQVQELVAASGADDVIFFIAKSRGTLFLSAIPPLVGAACRAIWVTPLFGLDYVEAGFVEKGWPSLVVRGAGIDGMTLLLTHGRAQLWAPTTLSSKGPTTFLLSSGTRDGRGTQRVC